jgi:large subunit ribosomal protein L20
MPRAKRGFKARRRRNRILNQAEGFWGGRSRLFAVAVEVVHKSWQYAYIGRKLRKRNFRRLWVARINAAARANGTTYSRLMGGLKTAQVGIDRKILADLAISDPGAFSAIAKLANEKTQAKPARA